MTYKAQCAIIITERKRKAPPDGRRKVIEMSKRTENKKLNLALCQGRHEIPQATDGAIFPAEIQDVTDTARLEEQAFNGLWNAAFRHHRNGEGGYLRMSPSWDGDGMEPLVLVPGTEVNLYVTGLTVALIAALNVCRREGLVVTLWHYDRATDGYYPQKVA